jgi:hypothetical protein
VHGRAFRSAFGFFGFIGARFVAASFSHLAVQRFSPSIGSLAAAPVKAQPELINPEKSLSATIRSEGTGGAEQSFADHPFFGAMRSKRRFCHDRPELIRAFNSRPK